MNFLAKYKVVVPKTNFPSLEVEEDLLQEVDADLEIYNYDSTEKIKNVAEDADALLTQFFTEIDADIIDSLQECKVIVCAGIGTNHIDVEAASEKGIYVANVPTYCEEEVASHTIALMLAISRKIVQYNEDIKAKNWNIYDHIPLKRYSDSTLGIIGLGKIGKMVAERAKPFGLDILSYDPYTNESKAKKLGVNLVQLDELIKKADFVCINAPLTPETKGILGEEEFKKMKESALLINTSRGGLIKEKDLYKALKSQQISGAALDVLTQEPPSEDNPLLQLKNVIFTPHVGWYSEGSEYELHYKMGKAIVDVLNGGEPDNYVNKV